MFRPVAICAALCLVAAVGVAFADETDDLKLRALLTDFLENSKRGSDGCMKNLDNGPMAFNWVVQDADKSKFGNIGLWLFKIDGSDQVNFGITIDKYEELIRKTRQWTPQKGAHEKKIDFETDDAYLTMTINFMDGTPVSACLAKS
ncbi:uncharacterized protein LOC119723164 [Patiria miniata]|uniref:Uncharacterized protein n=1 Tax=Patiria miniata TaxID=46514 RepID=A0A913ZF11_PATMI|nr:uncharacterized protein LOC119723164 [Patiria miniata]